MGIILSLIIITLILSLITFMLFANSEEGWGIICAVFATGFFIFSGICTFSMIDGIMSKSVYEQKYENERITLNRMLLENYNPDNLQKALDFNSTQKLIKIENGTFWRKYWTSVVYVDTVNIPNNNFMPSQKVVLLNIDSTTSK